MAPYLYQNSRSFQVKMIFSYSLLSFFRYEAFLDLYHESICQSVTFLPFFDAHKYYINNFDKITSEYFVDIFLDHIYLRFLAVFIYDNKIHFQVYIESLAEIILIDHHFVGLK